MLHFAAQEVSPFDSRGQKEVGGCLNIWEWNTLINCDCLWTSEVKHQLQEIF